MPVDREASAPAQVISERLRPGGIPLELLSNFLGLLQRAGGPPKRKATPVMGRMEMIKSQVSFAEESIPQLKRYMTPPITNRVVMTVKKGSSSLSQA